MWKFGFETRLVSVAAAVVLCAGPASAATVKVPEGTEMIVRLNDSLSSGTSTEGDQFSITLQEPVKLADGAVLQAGYRGRGEVAPAAITAFNGKSSTAATSVL